MALRKSELYQSLWDSCDELRGGMDASQYKDYVLTLLFVKYVSDKYAGDPNAVIVVPEGGSFDDMVALKGSKEIGDRINKIIGALAEANNLKGVIDVADFNDEDKLGRGKDMVDRLSNLVGIFQKLDLSANRAEGDDLLGDAYEYLMRNFATEAGKSKGQFYTPAEVSRIMARVIGIEPDTPQDRTVYDPTCGSGSLLLKAADEAERGLSIYGQERDNATAALARMNMILHDCAGAEIWRDNTLTRPHWTKPDGSLKTFDFAVANPPFSYKSWSNGLDPVNDEYRRFEYGVPPTKNGDYAFLLHVIASLKSTGTGAVILPHGVLFRGGSEAAIRANLIRRGLIQGVIGLPPNLFYGTGIPACIVVIDKSRAATRDSVFLIDANRGFRKEGNKNRLRAQDIHKIVDVFTSRREIPRYSRQVPVDEIAANDYNLNLPRYIDASEPEDLHDLDAHLNGGIPNRDLDGLEAYWSVFPDLRSALFEPEREGYSRARVPADEVKAVILEHPDFAAFRETVRERFEGWREAHEPTLRSIAVGDGPKAIARELSEDLLRRFEDAPLVDGYDVYQRFMDYWAETMQDDVYVLVQEGWGAARIIRLAEDSETSDFSLKRGKKTLKYIGEVIRAAYVIDCFFAEERGALEELEGRLEETAQRRVELEEEHGGDGGAFDGLEGSKGQVTKGNVRDRVAELKEAILKAFPEGSAEYAQAKSIRKTKFGAGPWVAGVEDQEELFAELDVLYEWLRLSGEEGQLKGKVGAATKTLYEAVIGQYQKLSEEEILELVVEWQWMTAVGAAVDSEVERVTQRLAGRVRELEERYREPMPSLSQRVTRWSTRVEQHLEIMGFKWGVERAYATDPSTGWSTRSLGDLGLWLSGGTPSLANESYWSGDIPWVSPKDMKRPRLRDSSDHISKEAMSGGARLAPRGALLMVVRGMILAHSFPVGRAERSLAFNQDMKALVPGVGVDSEFMLWWLQAHRSRFLSITTESTHGTKRIPSEALFAEQVLLPPLPEQRAIATALSDVDALMDSLDALIAKKRAIKTAAMQQLLTGRRRLPGFSGKWRRRPIGEIGATYGGLTGKTKRHFGVGSGRYVPFLNVMTNVVLDASFLELVDVGPGEGQNEVRRSDLLFNTSSETPEEVGMCSAVMADLEGVYLNSFCFGFRLYEKGHSPVFLAYLFRGTPGRRMMYSLAQGATRYNLSKKNFLRLEIPLPGHKEQIAIATVLSDMDAEIAALEARREKTRQIKQGMMQELLTGRVRLVTPEAEPARLVAEPRKSYG